MGTTTMGKLDSWVTRTIRDQATILYVLSVLSILVLIATLASMRTNTRQLVSITEQNHEILQEIQKCTLPGGNCAGVTHEEEIAASGRAAIAAAYCASTERSPSLDEARLCVTDALARLNNGQTP